MASELSWVLRRCLLVLGALAGVYMGAYVILSLNGSFVASETGNARVAGGGPLVADVVVWRPLFLHLRIFLSERGTIEREANALGWLFYPLELLDRRYWHPTRHPLLDLLNGLPSPESRGAP